VARGHTWRTAGLLQKRRPEKKSRLVEFPVRLASQFVAGNRKIAPLERLGFEPSGAGPSTDFIHDARAERSPRRDESITRAGKEFLSCSFA
jgi:hypothetical protein